MYNPFDWGGVYRPDEPAFQEAKANCQKLQAKNKKEWNLQKPPRKKRTPEEKAIKEAKRLERLHRRCKLNFRETQATLGYNPETAERIYWDRMTDRENFENMYGHHDPRFLKQLNLRKPGFSSASPAYAAAVADNVTSYNDSYSENR